MTQQTVPLCLTVVVLVIGSTSPTGVNCNDKCGIYIVNGSLVGGQIDHQPLGKNCNVVVSQIGLQPTGKNCNEVEGQFDPQPHGK